jgi:hypothetical protein
MGKELRMDNGDVVDADDLTTAEQAALRAYTRKGVILPDYEGVVAAYRAGKISADAFRP